MANYTDVVVYSSGRLVHPKSGDTLTTDLNVTVSGKLTATGDAAVDGDLVVGGSLTVNGSVTTISTTNLTVEDNLIMLNDGASSAAFDSGIIIERGSTGNNAAFIWDHSESAFKLGTTTATAGTQGELTVTTGDLLANVEGNVTFGNLVGSAGGVTVTQILDQDNMGDNSDSALATQQSIKAYVDSSISSGTAGSVAADNITTGTSAVTITTSTGDITIDAPSSQSVDLQVNGSNVVEVAGGRVDVSQPLVLGSNAAVSLTPESSASIAVGDVLALDGGGSLQVADANGTYKELIGVALEISGSGSSTDILVHTVHGSKVTVKSDGNGVTRGAPVYLDTTAGRVTATAPTAEASGYVYRVGIALGAESSNQTEILWMPQFIADLS